MEGRRITELDAEENIWTQYGRRSKEFNENCKIGWSHNFTIHKSLLRLWAKDSAKKQTLQKYGENKKTLKTFSSNNLKQKVKRHKCDVTIWGV